MLNPALSEKLNKALSLRYLSKVEEARELLNQEIDARSDSESWNVDEKLTVELIKASFLRYEMKAKAAEEILSSLLNQSGLNSHSQFHLFYQQALNLDAQSRFAESLGFYQKALKVATTSIERLMCKYNLAIVRYHLGIPLNGLFNEIRELVDKNPEHPFAEGFKKIELIFLRQDFLNGDVSEVINCSSRELHQGLYFCAWLSALPWLKDRFQQKRDDFIELGLTTQDFFLKEYRLQTILADSRLSKSNRPSNIQAQIDRLYAWTWMWLAQPNSHIKVLLGEELKNFPFDTASQNMTSEDFLLMSSIGGWLGLFHSDFRIFFDDWSAKYIPKDERTLPEFFEIDQEVRRILGQGQWKKNFKKLMHKYPDHQRYFEVINNLIVRDQKSSHRVSTASVFVTENMVRSRSVEVRSRSLAKLAKLLKAEGRVHFSRVLEICFDIPLYDEFVHAPKVNNLVARLKRLSQSGAEIYTKNSEVVLVDQKNEFIIQDYALHHLHFPKFTVLKARDLNTLAVQRHFKHTVGFRAQVSLLFEKKEQLKRADIQTHLQLSKASTLRWIDSAVAGGILIKQGHGRDTRYARNPNT